MVDCVCDCLYLVPHFSCYYDLSFRCCGVRIADCFRQYMAIASICHVTVTVCQSGGYIRVSVLVGGVQIAARWLWDMAIASI